MAAGGGRWLGPWDAPVKSALQIYAIVGRLALDSAINIAGRWHASTVCPLLRLNRTAIVWVWEGKPSSRGNAKPLFKTQMFPCLAKWVGVLRSTPHGDANKTLLWSPATSKDLISSAESELPEAGTLPEPRPRSAYT